VRIHRQSARFWCFAERRSRPERCGGTWIVVAVAESFASIGANSESDEVCTGQIWEGRFKLQILPMKPACWPVPPTLTSIRCRAAIAGNPRDQRTHGRRDRIATSVSEMDRTPAQARTLGSGVAVARQRRGLDEADRNLTEQQSGRPCLEDSGSTAASSRILAVFVSPVILSC